MRSKYILVFIFCFQSALAQEQHTPTIIETTSHSTDSLIVATITHTDGTIQQIDQKTLLLAHQLGSSEQSLDRSLEQLIDLYVLGYQAQTKQLNHHPNVKDEKARAALRHFISDEFEKTYRLETLPQTYIDQATRQNIGLFKHPELRQGVHILLKPLHSQSTAMTEEQEKILLPFVQKVTDDMTESPIKDAEDLQRRALRYQPWLPEGYEVIYEDLGRFSENGPFIAEFNEPCFAQKTVPAIVGPIKTPYGFHFAWLKEIIPPLDTPDEEIERVVRQRILPEVRSYEWRLLLSKLIEQAEQDEQKP